jgi:hypothetical protein
MSKIEDLVYSAMEHGRRDMLLQRVNELKKHSPNRPLSEVYDEAYREVMHTS